ncbi:MAG: hypothetical protein QXN96_05455 [Candidatus Bathyarchaeia archaeon]
MKKQKYPIEEMKRMEQELLSIGIPTYKAHKIIGQRLCGGCSRSTVRRYLVPGEKIFFLEKRN